MDNQTHKILRRIIPIFLTFFLLILAGTYLRRTPKMDSTAPLVVVKGVYRLPVTDEFLTELARLSMAEFKYFDPPEYEKEALEDEKERYRELLVDTALIELVIENVDEHFTEDDFIQESQGTRQAAWMETYLDLDGTRIIARKEALASPSGTLRVAYYHHLFDSSRPIRTSYGEISLPAPSPMPERLWMIMPWVDFE